MKAFWSAPVSKKLLAAVCMALDQHPCGIIVLKYDDTAIKAVTYIPESMPCVVIGGDFDPYHAHISLDEYQAGLRLTEYLLRTGAPTVHHVSVPGAGGGRNRSSGWRAALRNRGLDIPESFTVGWSPDKARDLGRQFAHRPDITAIFAGNDEIAMGLMSGLMDEGRRIPGDVRVVGFDDHPLSAIWGSIFFGALMILYLRLVIAFIPTQLYKILPYVVTVIVLIISSMRNNKEKQPPASLGLNYFREER